MSPPASTVDIDQALREAEAALSEGRAASVLDELIERDRRRPDDRLATVLVALRHAAFGELDRSPGRAEWPLDLPDPFPGERGIPAAARRDLSGDLLGGALVHHGCLRVDGLLSTDQAGALRGQIEDSFSARARLQEGGAPEEAAPQFVPFAPGQARADGFGTQAFIRAVDAPVALRDVAAAFAETGVAGAVGEYFGERPAMIANKWVLRRTPTGKVGTDFHQDGAFLGEGIRTVDCWISLSHCGPGTGRPAMDLVPARFPLLESGEGAAFRWSLTEGAVREAAPEVALHSPVFGPGDALFFDERLPHRTSVGTDLSERHAIESWFVAPSSYPARHVPVVL